VIGLLITTTALGREFLFLVVLSSVASLALPHISALSHKRQDFRRSCWI